MVVVPPDARSVILNEKNPCGKVSLGLSTLRVASSATAVRFKKPPELVRKVVVPVPVAVITEACEGAGAPLTCLLPTDAPTTASINIMKEKRTLGIAMFPSQT